MKNKVAVSHGSKFLIVDEADLVGICLKPSNVVVQVKGFMYIVNRGKEYLDAIAVEKLINAREEDVHEIFKHAI